MSLDDHLPPGRVACSDSVVPLGALGASSHPQPDRDRRMSRIRHGVVSLSRGQRSHPADRRRPICLRLRPVSCRSLDHSEGALREPPCSRRYSVCCCGTEKSISEEEGVGLAVHCLHGNRLKSARWNSAVWRTFTLTGLVTTAHGGLCSRTSFSALRMFRIRYCSMLPTKRPESRLDARGLRHSNSRSLAPVLIRST